MVAKNSKSQTEEREAILTLRYITTKIQRPLNRTEPELPSELSINLVNVAEEDPPEGVEPIEWMLTTNLELKSCEDALLVVDYYRQRWKIERFFYVLKSGCRIEELQQHSVDRIEIMVLLYSLISVHIMMLTYLSRLYPELSCELLFSQSEWQLLYRAAKRTTVAPDKPYSMADVVRFVAVLGGFVGAPSDGLPGLKVVWMGLSKFFTLYAFREFI
ncbi:MAG: IS4 family transposase [Nitrososphaerota archaeon]|nr:IS4 family transposase [Nitrososphaerota archaeon]